jgi:glycosyltransferase involved in cell wall biosynthesis
MRIGLVTGEYPPMQGGVGDFSHELGRALVTLGHQVDVITRVGCGQAGAETEGDLRVHPMVPHWGWRSIRQVLDLAQRLGSEVLNIQYQAVAFDMHPAINFLPGPGRRIASKSPSPPVVVTFHDLKFPYLFPKAGPLRDWVVNLLARQADAAIATNRADELALQARGMRHVTRIPIGSNIRPRLPRDYDRVSWRAGLGLSAQACLLGFFGFFNARKGVETLVRALARLDPTHHLLFIGGTAGSSDASNRSYARRIEDLITELGLDDRVHYTGYVAAEQVSAAFAALDLCVLPYADGISFHHGTLMAALVHGQAIVSTSPAIELPELVHGENVWLVPPEEPETLAAAITALAADPVRRQHLARGAAGLAPQFSWPTIAARTAQLFDDLSYTR